MGREAHRPNLRTAPVRFIPSYGTMAPPLALEIPRKGALLLLDADANLGSIG